MASTASSFQQFKTSISPYMDGVKQIALDQLQLFTKFDTMANKAVTDKDIADYRSYIVYHQNNPIISSKSVGRKPTLEVQLLWIVHSLNPKQYFADTQKAFGTVIPVRLSTTFEPSSDDHKQQKAEQKSAFAQGLDLKPAVSRQFKFIDKMNVIQKTKNISESQIDAAIERYYKFLFLLKMTKGTGAVCVPTLDIDLIWHSHQISAVKYHKMSSFMFPGVSVIGHDDGMSEENLKKYKAETQSRWNEVFGDGDYLRGRTFSRVNHSSNSNNARKRKLEDLCEEDEMEPETKRRRISSEEYDGLKERLNKEIKARKKLEKRVERYAEEVAELESRLEDCECGQNAGCGACG